MIPYQRSDLRSTASGSLHNDAYTLTSTTGYDPFPPLILRETRHEVVCAPNLETEHLVKIFTFKIDLVAKFRAQVFGENERGLLDDVVDF